MSIPCSVQADEGGNMDITQHYQMSYWEGYLNQSYEGELIGEEPLSIALCRAAVHDRRALLSLIK